jgi:hypothetical protein
MDRRFKCLAAAVAAGLLLHFGTGPDGVSAQEKQAEKPGIGTNRSESTTAGFLEEQLRKACIAAGISPSETGDLMKVVAEAETEGLPLEPLVGKIEEGLVKGVSTSLIVTVVQRQMQALRYVKAVLPAVHNNFAAQQAWIAIADSLGQGISRDELHAFIAQAPEAPLPMLAIAVENLSLLRQIDIEPEQILAILNTGLDHNSLDPSYRYLAKFFVVGEDRGIPASKMVTETIRALEAGENLRQLMQRLGFTGRDMRHRPGTE